MFHFKGFGINELKRGLNFYLCQKYKFHLLTQKDN
jgi:hypothetical protein